jgi:GTP-binding protein
VSEIDLEPGADPERAERARKLFSGPITFLKSAPALEHLPSPSVPESHLRGARTSANRRCSTR